jgi:hypothetical protein
MSEGNWLPDTAYLGTHWCPDCEPGRDPAVEILETRYCIHHELRTPGADDARVVAEGPLSNGANEAEGTTCRLFAQLLKEAP